MKGSFAGLILLIALDLVAQPTVELVTEATGLGFIVDIAHAGDDRIFCLTKHGVINIVQNGNVLPVPFLDISAQVYSAIEAGALGLVFDPDFSINGWFYIHYINNADEIESRISRFAVSALDPNVADPASELVLYQFPNASPFHKGGDIDFGPDGTLYFAFGDAMNSAAAQDHSSPLGGIVRIDISAGDGSYAIPADNPFASAGGDTLPEIWAKGLRNPWRFGFDALTGDIWIADVGSTEWEEVNFRPAGDHSGPNFGWKCFEGFDEVPATEGCGPASDYDGPILVHPTSTWCAIIGGRVYRGSDFPALYGRYIYTDQCAGVVHSILPDGDGGWLDEELASVDEAGFICIGEDHDLELFIGRSNGTLYRIVDPLSVATPDLDAPNITVHPVPANDQLSITGDLARAGKIQLFDQAGRLVIEGAAHSRTYADLNVSQLANGIYMLVIIDRSGQEMLRRPVPVVH